MKTKNLKIILSKIITNIALAILILMLAYNIIYISKKTFSNSKNINVLWSKNFIIEDNLMSPTLNKNDIVFVKKCSREDIRVGDIVAFYQNNSLKINRITQEIILGEGINEIVNYATKGDNNYYNNIEQISINDIEGKVSNKIPKLGFLIKIARSKIFTVICLIIINLIYFQSKSSKNKSFQRRKKLRQIKKDSKNIEEI